MYKLHKFHMMFEYKYINRNLSMGQFDTVIIKINGKSYNIKLKNVKTLHDNSIVRPRDPIVKWDITKEIYYKKYNIIIRVTFIENTNSIHIYIHDESTYKSLVFQFQEMCLLIMYGLIKTSRMVFKKL